jgi:hypothetical protein
MARRRPTWRHGRHLAQGLWRHPTWWPGWRRRVGRICLYSLVAGRTRQPYTVIFIGEVTSPTNVTYIRW